MSNPADTITLAISKLTIDAQSHSSSPSRPSQEVLNLLTEGHHALLSYIGELHSCFADCRYCATDTGARDVDVVVPEMIAFCHRYFEDCGDGCPFGGDCVDCQEEAGGEGGGEEEREVDVMGEGTGAMEVEGGLEPMPGAEEEEEDEDMEMLDDMGPEELIGVRAMELEESGRIVMDDKGEMQML